MGSRRRLRKRLSKQLNDTTFAPNPELVAKLKSELNVTSDLPLVINDQVAGYINVFSNFNQLSRAHGGFASTAESRYKTG